MRFPFFLQVLRLPVIVRVVDFPVNYQRYRARFQLQFATVGLLGYVCFYTFDICHVLMKRISVSFQIKTRNGVETGSDTQPSMAALINVVTATVTCAAIIINLRNLVAAAHCFASSTKYDFGVLVGNDDNNKR